MKTITKNDIVDEVCNRTGLTKQQSYDAIQHTLDIIKDSLANGDEVVFRNFGSFHTQFYKSKVGRNPEIPEVDVIIPDRVRVKFKAGKELKEKVARIEW